MLVTVDKGNAARYKTACAFERVMGSKCLNSYECYGETRPDLRFLLQQTQSGEPAAALYLSGGVLLVSAGEQADADEIAAFAQEHGVGEIDTNIALTTALQERMGGTIESSYYMVYDSAAAPEGDFSAVQPYHSLEDIFSILQQSHEYYRTHLQFEPWAADLRARMAHGSLALFQLNLDGIPVGTGSIASQDDECGVVAAVAVVPEHRGKGLGSLISKCITRRILELGKTPRLISGYDEVAELYKQVGYRTVGRWGELYL